MSAQHSTACKRLWSISFRRFSLGPSAAHTHRSVADCGYCFFGASSSPSRRTLWAIFSPSRCPLCLSHQLVQRGKPHPFKQNRPGPYFSHSSQGRELCFEVYHAQIFFLEDQTSCPIAVLRVPIPATWAPSATTTGVAPFQPFVRHATLITSPHCSFLLEREPGLFLMPAYCPTWRASAPLCPHTSLT